jgi:hypothetical protein
MGIQRILSAFASESQISHVVKPIPGIERRGRSLNRHAGAELRSAARLHRQERSGNRDDRPGRRRGVDAARLPPERRGTGRLDQFPLDDGANRVREDRKYGVFNVQPEFAAK